MIHVSDRGERGQVRVVTIDRQDRRNAVDHEALEGLLAAVRGGVGRPATRVLVLAGEGGHFCAGADLSGVEDTAFVAALGAVLAALRDAPFPTIAAVEGAALGAGTQLAIACDLRCATADATFGVPAAKLGLMVDQWTIRRLVDVAGQGAARATLLAAETFTGERAHQLGLVQRLCAVREAVDWAETIATLAPLTIAGHKVGLNEVEHLGGRSAAYDEAFVRAWTSADLQEGLTAFRERRAPDFRGA